MQTVQQIYNPGLVKAEKRQSILSRFLDWCDRQEVSRLGWTAAIIALHGCFLTPITVGTVAMTSNSLALWAAAIGAMAMTLITNLSAMPTKVTIPVFILSVVIDISVVTIAVGGINFF